MQDASLDLTSPCAAPHLYPSPNPNLNPYPESESFAHAGGCSCHCRSGCQRSMFDALGACCIGITAAGATEGPQASSESLGPAAWTADWPSRSRPRPRRARRIVDCDREGLASRSARRAWARSTDVSVRVF